MYATKELPASARGCYLFARENHVIGGVTAKAIANRDAGLESSRVETSG